MRIALLGATGGIGSHLLSWATGNGHPVHALVRDPGRVAARDGLIVTGGDAMDADAVAHVIDGADAVLSALGPRGAKTPDLLATAARNTVTAMRETGARRLVCVSAAGAYVTDDPGRGFLIKAILPRIFAGPFADVRRMETAIRESGLDWTLVRASRLVSKPGTGRYRVAPDFTPPGGGKISRADVAHFIAGALADHNWVGGSPALAY